MRTHITSAFWVYINGIQIEHTLGLLEQNKNTVLRKFHQETLLFNSALIIHDVKLLIDKKTNI